MNRITASLLVLVGLLSLACAAILDATLFTHQNSANPAFCLVRPLIGGPSPGQPPAAFTVVNNANGFSTNYFQFSLAGLSAASKASFKTYVLDTSGGIFVFKDTAPVTEPLTCDNIPAERNFSREILAPLHGGLNEYTLDITELFNEYIARGETTLTLLLTADLGVSVTTGNFRRLEVEESSAPTVQPPSDSCTASVTAVARLAEGSTWNNDGKSFHTYDIVVTNTGSLGVTYIALSITGAPVYNSWGMSSETGAVFLNGSPLAPTRATYAGFITSAAISSLPSLTVTVSSVQCA